MQAIGEACLIPSLRWLALHDPITLLAVVIAAPSCVVARWQAWTALPGDRFDHMPRFVVGTVVKSGRCGRATLLVESRESLLLGSDARWPARIEHDVDLADWYRL